MEFWLSYFKSWKLMLCNATLKMPASLENSAVATVLKRCISFQSQIEWGKRNFFCFSSVQSFIHVWLFGTPWTAAHQAFLSITNFQNYPNSCPMSQWCNPTISSSVVPFSSCPQSFPASGSFQMSQLSTSGGQNIGVSASTWVLPKNTQDWSPLGWTSWISLQSLGLSRVFSSKPQFKNINYLALILLYSPTLTSMHDYWKNNSLD